jgi:hypothetical protein
MSTKSEQNRVKNLKNGMIGTMGDSSTDSLLQKPQQVDSKVETEDAYPSVEEWIAMPDNEKINVLHDSLLELYLNVKIRNFDRTIDSNRVDEELDKLK